MKKKKPKISTAARLQMALELLEREEVCECQCGHKHIVTKGFLPREEVLELLNLDPEEIEE